MYRSSILSKALVYVYSSRQWKAAMCTTYRKADTFECPLGESFAEDEWFHCPPPPLVAFVGTLVS